MSFWVFRRPPHRFPQPILVPSNPPAVAGGTVRMRTMTGVGT